MVNMPKKTRYFEEFEMVYIQLFVSVVFEVVATSLMKKTDGFTNLPITALMLACYGAAFFFMSIVVKTLPIGMVYATWSGLGIVLVSAVAYLVYKQVLDLPAIIGMTLIIAGVVLINVFSKTSAH